MKKALALLLCALMVFAFVACKPQETQTPPVATEEPAPVATETPAAPAVADGTYEGTAGGFHGPVTVAVTIAGEKLTNVEIKSHVETAGVSDNAVALMPGRIVDNQSFNVDVVSGSTYSSNAIKFAVRSALESANAADLFSAEPAAPAQTEETLTYDVVVIGTGMGGLTAAIEAKKAGANVLVLEKLGRFGGSSVTSGGIIYATGSPLNKDYDNDPADVAAYWQERANGTADMTLLTYAAEHSGETVQWLMDNGVTFNPDTIYPTGTSPKPRGHYTAGGAAVIVPLYNKVKELGIEVLFETKATELIALDGAVVGVKAESKAAKYTINAKAVVMATGGFDASPELLAKYSPDAAGAACGSAIGNTGDGIAMGEAVGAATLFKGGVIGFRCINPALDMGSGPNMLMWTPTLVVTDEGNRFTNESTDYPIYFTNMAKTGRDVFYMIFDSANPDLCELAVNQGFGFKADTIDALAAAAGIDPATLQATFDRYQELGAKGADDDFGKAGIAPLAAEGPYYAIKLMKGTIGTMGGLMINVNAEVLNADGVAIKGFYAIGEVANGQLFDKEYPASGTSLSITCSLARVAGANAAAAK